VARSFLLFSPSSLSVFYNYNSKEKNINVNHKKEEIYFHNAEMKMEDKIYRCERRIFLDDNKREEAKIVKL